MRTADTIWKEECALWETTNIGSLEDHIHRSIKKGMVEAIHDCAEKAKVKSSLEPSHFGNLGMERTEVDKQSILALLDQIK